MLPLKILITLQKFLHLNIMTLRKCTTLKYLSKINRYPCFIYMYFLLIKILMTFKISWIELKKNDIIAISETRITRQASLLNNLNLNNCSFEFTPTDTSAGGTLLYIGNHLSHKCRNDLNICKKMNWNLLLLKFLTRENQILLWESFTDIHLRILLTLIAVT